MVVLNVFTNRSSEDEFCWPVRCFTLLSVIVLALIPFTFAQTLISPGPEVVDAFKENPKWLEFVLLQAESIDRLRTLVENVWALIDSIPNPSDKTDLKESFVKFHVPEFLAFLRERSERLRDGNPFPVLNAAIGINHMHVLERLATSSDALIRLKLKWIAMQELAAVIHFAFNASTTKILSGEHDYQAGVIQILSEDRFPIWGAKFLEDGMRKIGASLNVVEVGQLLDREIVRSGNGTGHLIRRLLVLLSSIKQPETSATDELNYFCYGNNEFGVIPDIFDVIGDAASLLVTADMELLFMNVYNHTMQTFFKGKDANDKQIVRQKREAIWAEMLGRIQRKIKFPMFDGAGWPHPAGPVVFKCDLPPYNFAGERGQWGRNISTGVKPSASPSFPYDPPAGPLKDNDTVGYLDDRRPDVVAVGFEKAFKGYLESELALDPDATCGGTCSDFKRPTTLCRGPHCPLLRNSHCSDRSTKCLEKPQCPQYAMNCRRAGAEVRICASNDSSKPYEWISFNETVIGLPNFGNENPAQPPCAGEITTAREFWEMGNGVVLKTPNYCELCLCNCMTPFDPKDREYFDLSPLTSNAEKGFIVSAVRFVKDGNTIRLAIEEGKPIMNGVVNESSLRWIEKPSTETKQIPLGVGGFRRLNFDLILGEDGTVVTGLRFKYNEADRSLNLEIQTTAIVWPDDNPTAISLNMSESKWISALPRSRNPIDISVVYDPRRQPGPSMPDSVLNSYVEFGATSLESDLGQTVVPLFDAQPVFYYERRRWLRGIGVMHKGRNGSGGFVCPSIVPASPYRTVHFHPKPTNDTVIAV